MARPVACSRCGRVPDPADEVPVTWSMETSPRGVLWVCEQCTRAGLRSMEGRLDNEWW